jgi:hypothetical protein
MPASILRRAAETSPRSVINPRRIAWQLISAEDRVDMRAVLPALAATFVYVSNADDGDIGVYTLQADGPLQAGPRVPAAKVVMPITSWPWSREAITRLAARPTWGAISSARLIEPPLNPLTPAVTFRSQSLWGARPAPG